MKIQLLSTVGLVALASSYEIFDHSSEYPGMENADNSIIDFFCPCTDTDPPTRFPDFSNCAGYYECHNGKAEQKVCDGNNLYSIWKK